MDSIANMLTMIRNAQAVKKETVSISHSKINLKIAEILVKEGFLKEIIKKGKKNKKVIDLILKYTENGQPAISHLKKVSKPSRRIYLSLKQIRPVQRGYGLQILTTPKGILTDKEARKEKVGGEVICKIW